LLFFGLRRLRSGLLNEGRGALDVWDYNPTIHSQSAADVLTRRAKRHGGALQSDETSLNFGNKAPVLQLLAFAAQSSPGELMSQQYILALDQGRPATRAILFDPQRPRESPAKLNQEF